MFKISVDASAIQAALRRLEVAGEKLPSITAMVLNRVNTKVRQRVVDRLPEQTGLTRYTIAKAIKTRRASPGKLRAETYSRGGNISLKFFRPHEGGGGADAVVKGHHVHVAGGFRRAGPQGGRHAVKKLGGHVFTNTDGGKWRGHMKKVKSGVFIPKEMVTGASLDAFNQVVSTDLEAEIAKELTKILGK